jgi:hypothetical protein
VGGGCRIYETVVWSGAAWSAHAHGGWAW